MPLPSNPSRIREIFIGSTMQDLGEYRKQVRDALATGARVGAYLSEHWSGGYDDTVRRCRERLYGADAYFGIFGYWYGSIPPGSTRSITHEEFLWALERWGDAVPPLLAVFIPVGEADKELRARAEEVFLSEHGHRSAEEREAERQLHATRLKAFHETVRQPLDTWRAPNPFDSTTTLREQAIVTALTWNQDLMLTALAPRSYARQASDEELGMLGRDEHTSAARRAAALSAVHDVPGVALLVAGDEDAGQRELCSHLLTLRPFREGRPRRGRPPLERYDLETFVDWCGQTLGFAPADGRVTTVAALAERIHQVLRDQPLTLVVDHVERLEGRTRGFYEHFWRPLFTALRERRRGGPSAHRLLLIVSEYTGRSSEWEDVSRALHETGDPSLLVRLPPLGPITGDDLLGWMDEVEVPDAAVGRRLSVLERVLRNPDGVEDGTPQRVFSRLRNENLWPHNE